MRPNSYHSLINSWRPYLVISYIHSITCSLNINHFAIDKKTCDSRALSDLSPTPSPIVTSKGLTQNGLTETVATREKQGPTESEYSKNCRANIEKNNLLMASLGLDGGGVGILGESSLGKKKKNK